MPAKKRQPTTMATLRALAPQGPDVAEGVACAGTAVESVTLKASGKAFLFLRQTQAMFKLEASLPRAREIAVSHPEQLRAGSGGWVTLNLPDDGTVEPAELARWIEESRATVSTAKPTAKKRPARRR